jgi:1,5-anhydro-D-fructose reductase (1,5-anhydro-D-mannitol-forming)
MEMRDFIDDADFIQYLFGLPRAVHTSAVRGPSGDYDHCVTNYIYDGEPAVTAEGGWIMTDGFGFEMSFNIVLEKAVIQYDSTRDPAFRICPADGNAYTPEIACGDGYSHEIAHFKDRFLGLPTEEILTPRQSTDSVALVLAEKRSADLGRVIPYSSSWTAP